MNKIIFFDTETTDNVDKGRLIQLGVKERGVEKPIVNALYKAPTAITIDSMAVHHITPKMIAEKPAFMEAPEYASLKELFESNMTFAVAHNAAFDVAMLRREEIDPANVICTMKVARALDTEEKISSYRLQYLRYYLGIEVEGVNAHDAWGDVVVLEQLFERLLARMVKDGKTEEEALKEMIALSRRPSLLRTVRFGKHNGEKIADIVKSDRGYLEWLYKQKKENPAGEEDWLYTLEDVLDLPHTNTTLWD